MATKKVKVVKEHFIVRADDDCLVNEDGEYNDMALEYIFSSENEATKAAMRCLYMYSDEHDILVLYKLVPVARVKKAQAVVEKL